MKHINPFDRIVQQKLSNYANETPMHLWEPIDKKRSFLKHNARQQWRKRYVLLLLLLISSTSTWLAYRYFSTKNAVVSPLPSTELVPIAINNRATDISNELPTFLPLKTPTPIAITTIKTTKPTLKTAFQAVQNKKPIPDETKLKNQQKTTRTFLKEIKRLSENTSLTPLNRPNDSTLEIVNLIGEENNSNSDKPINSKRKSNKSWFLTNKTKLLKNPKMALPNPTTCYSFRGHPLDIRAIYVDALLTPEYAIRRLSTKTPNDSQQKEYRNWRNETEQRFWAGSAGLRLSVVGNNGIAYRLGLNYSQINEKLDYTNESEERITIVNIYDDYGNIIDTDTTIESGMQRIMHHNKFSMIDIPIILGYEVEAEKFALTFNAGAYVNLVFQKEGQLLSPELQLIDFNSTFADDDSVFKKQLDISWYSSIGFNYRLSNRLQWIIEPQIRYYPASFTTNEFPMKQNYFNFGLSTGLRMRL